MRVNFFNFCEIVNSVRLITIALFLFVANAYAQNFEQHSSKKGLAIRTQNPVHAEMLEALNVSWFYSWGENASTTADPRIEFVPMRKRSIGDASEYKIPEQSGNFKYFLGYNEPDQPLQANMTVEQALAEWPIIADAVRSRQYQDENEQIQNVKLGSPAVSLDWDTSPWQQEFMDRVDRSQIDFMAIHKYPLPTKPNAVLASVENFYRLYEKPIWLTEFTAADWKETGVYTDEQTYTFLAEVLYDLERSPLVERYAIYPFNGPAAAGPFSKLFTQSNPDNPAELTPLGKLYAKYRSSDINGLNEDTWYYKYPITCLIAHTIDRLHSDLIESNSNSIFQFFISLST